MAITTTQAHIRLNHPQYPVTTPLLRYHHDFEPRLTSPNAQTFIGNCASPTPDVLHQALATWVRPECRVWVIGLQNVK